MLRGHLASACLAWWQVRRSARFSRVGESWSRSAGPPETVGGAGSGSVFVFEGGVGELVSGGYFYYYSVSERVIFEKSA